MGRRTTWYAPDLRIKNEPLMKSLIEYRLDEDRKLTSLWPEKNSVGKRESRLGIPNLESSLTTSGKQMPILDLDFPHHVESSTTDGHSHLYIDVEISKIRWTVLMLALWFAGVIEMGNAVWSLRRGANFVRINPDKTEEESVKPEYGWFRKLKNRG